ncbi:MAG: zinc ABC transporter substrate-binding protein [Actinomycetia bacterium]|nr:zinc ABC transporter substrate-binding protein [Actinomycetes bacterium]
MFSPGALVRGSAALVAALALAGCTASPAGPAPSDGRPVVVAAVYPLEYAAQRVAGGLADVGVLVPPGTEPHDFEIAPRQMAALRTASLVVYQAGVDAAIDEAVANARPAVVLETGSLVHLQAPGGESGATTTAAYAYDPHTWLDPSNMATFAGAIAAELARIDPDHAATYRTNAAAFEADLTSLDADFQAGLADCRTSTFLTTHAAFGYLASRYGLTQLAIAGVSPEDEPSPRRLGELAQEARANGLTTVFFETLVSPDYAHTLAGDLGLRTDVLDPIEGVTEASRGGDYLEIMRSNLTALRLACGCA